MMRINKYKKLIYLSPVKWNSFSQRPHHFVSWFNLRTGGQVFWIDPYPTRLPKLKDLKILFNNRSKSKFNKNYSWLKLIKIYALPIEPLDPLSKINNIFWTQIKKRIDNFIKDSEYLIVIGKPSIFSISLLDRLKPKFSIYDSMDDFPLFCEGISSKKMRRNENILASKVNKIICSSKNLNKKWDKYKNKIIFIKNGLNENNKEFFPDIRTNKIQFVFGYIGTIGKWFDWDWIINLCTIRPKDKIVLIGDIHFFYKGSMPSNLYLFPPINHEKANEAISSFDIGLIPFKVNTLTESVDPLKYYEYIGCGLPVISTNFGEMKYRQNDEGVFISKKIDDVAKQINKALKFKFSSGYVETFKKKENFINKLDIMLSDYINIIN